jgi:tRNA A-37 threonylcarbamoyl transferase component Bud32
MENNNSTARVPELTWKTLKIAGRAIPSAFQLKLEGTETILHCDEVVRLVPGRRLVAFGTWGDHPVVAKIFFASGKTKRHLEREAAGIKLLKEAGVPSPSILWQGSAEKNKIKIILFERILEGTSLDSIWQQKKSNEEIMPLLRAVTIELATQHVLGIIQRDLHLKNFLISQSKIYTIDGGSIEKYDGILPKEESIECLALFFAQLGVEAETLQKDLFHAYALSRGWVIKKNDYKLLRLATKKFLEKRWIRFEKKLRRNSSAFLRRKKFSSLTMLDKTFASAEMENFLTHPDLFIHHPDSIILKAGRSTTVAKIRIGEQFFVVKRYNVKSAWHWLRRCFRTTRAEKCWRLGLHLQLLGVRTARPVAFIETRFFGLRGKSYFLMQHVDAPHIGNYFENYRPGDESYLPVAEEVIALFTILAKLRITHGDLKMTNILIEDRHPLLIDLDGMEEHTSSLSLKHAFKKEIKRFMKNWENQPSVHALFEKIIN